MISKFIIITIKRNNGILSFKLNKKRKRDLSQFRYFNEGNNGI